MLSSAAYETSYNNDELGYIDWLRYVRLIASEERSFSVFRARKGRKGERGKSPTLWLGRANAAHQLVPVHVRHPDITDQGIRF